MTVDPFRPEAIQSQTFLAAFEFADNLISLISANMSIIACVDGSSMKVTAPNGLAAGALRWTLRFKLGSGAAMLQGLCRGGRFRARLRSGCAHRHAGRLCHPAGVRRSGAGRAAPGVKTLPVYVATNRQRAAGADLVFTADAAPAPNYAKFVVTVPPDHKSGNIEWPQGTPDPRVNFATIDQSALSDAAFRDAVAPPKVRGKRYDVVVFIHGYNNNFQESLYRLAQIGADSGIDAMPVLFAWPSQGRPIGYDADKQAALASRGTR